MLHRRVWTLLFLWTLALTGFTVFCAPYCYYSYCEQGELRELRMGRLEVIEQRLAYHILESKLKDRENALAYELADLRKKVKDQSTTMKANMPAYLPDPKDLEPRKFVLPNQQIETLVKPECLNEMDGDEPIKP